MTLAELVLTNLRANAENKDDGWGDVYLDNARPEGMSDKSFRSCLASLAGADLYKVIDGYAWGKVRLNN